MSRYAAFILMLGCLLPVTANALFSHPDLADIPTPPNADVALMVVDTTNGNEIYAERADQFQQPASLQKLVTALAGKLYLKDDFRFDTTIESRGKDIIVRLGGDPSFTHTDLRVLVEKLKTQHPEIHGNLILNGGIFEPFERAIGLPWDIMGICYSAPSSAFTLNGNCVYGKLEATSEAPVTAVKVSASDRVTIDTNRIHLREGLNTDNIDCELKLTADNNNHYQVGGCVGVHRLPVNFHLSVQNPEKVMTAILREELARVGITLHGKLIRNDQLRGDIILRHQSAPLAKLIDEMVKKSDNLIADNLLKTIGARYFSTAGSFENGAAAIKAILNEHNVDIGTAEIMDGSGLSRNNKMTPRQMMRVVNYIFQHPEAGMIDTLPVSGVSGTLQWRPSLVNAPLKGKVTAKTGSLHGVYNLAGRIKTKSGKSLTFVQIISNYHPQSQNRNIARKPIRVFEKSFYESLYNKY
ncbi:D-alanyl-D-alanine carboxypeptidase [Methylophaga frappieri]|uniref:D-alanyl-D-alanine carboxypeptidase n=1 Tax=Methylophaga frappieri (strain ATCC BAA-2434 / DSM 25690 / JAM7) TaxID=754477 RepID=I1YL87_METFJ|nr:D-alanyl-D-alanine carboxypeptidase/D-alanyl-D-alanine-endopeptidase [Methylophaga frappieri]AFJ03680.1 D-alanyl-D-alanine carboxypeptidase [Methylophaga frappieri]